MNSTTYLSSQTLKDNSFIFTDPSSKLLIEIKQENGKLVYSIIRSQNYFSRMSTDRLPPLLRQFTNLSQLLAFLRNGNTIKVRTQRDQEYSLDILIPCHGGVPWVPILIWLATTGIAIAAEHWIVRPYLIQPLRDSVQKSSLSENAKMVAYFAIEAADFALMVLFGGALQAGVQNGMTKLASKQAADIAVKVFEKRITEKVVEEVAKEGALTATATIVSQGLSFFEKLALGAKDFLIFEDSFMKAAVRHGLEEPVLKEALTSFYYHLGTAVPRMALSLETATTLQAAIEKCQTLAEQNAFNKGEIQDLKKGQAEQKFGQRIDEWLEESQKLQNSDKIRRDEKIKTGKRIYLKHIQQGYDINDELRSQIKDATKLSDKSVEKLIQKLMQKYPPDSEIDSDTHSQVSDFSDLSLTSTHSSNLHLGVNDDFNERNVW